MAEQSSDTTVRTLGNYIVENLKKRSPQYIKRFNCVLEFYGYLTIDADLKEFLLLILIQPDKIKVNDKIIKKWKSESSIGAYLNTVLYVCEMPRIVDILGDKHQLVHQAYKDFIKEVCIQAVNNRVSTKKNATSVAHEKEKGEVHNVEVCDDSDGPHSRHKELHCTPPEETANSEFEEGECSDDIDIRSLNNAVGEILDGTNSVISSETSHEHSNDDDYKIKYLKLKQAVAWYVDSLSHIQGMPMGFVRIMEEHLAAL
jgi:hypothetical protein